MGTGPPELPVVELGEGLELDVQLASVGAAEPVAELAGEAEDVGEVEDAVAEAGVVEDREIPYIIDSLGRTVLMSLPCLI